MDDESRSCCPSRSIGSLMSETLNSLSITAGTMPGSTGRDRNAATTISRKATGSPISTRHGAPGSGTPRISLPAVLARTDLLAALHRNPARLLPPCVQSSLAETTDNFGSAASGWDGYAVRYEVTQPIGDGDRAAALAFVAETLKPASEEFVIAELGRLRLLTVSRDIGQDLAFVFAVYADELKRYPADAVRDVLRGWRGKWWPAWAELSEKLDRLVVARKALRDALKRGYRQPEYSPDWIPPPTDEQKREVDALLAEHGILVDERGRVRPLEPEPVVLADVERAERELPQIREMWIKRLLGSEPLARPAGGAALGREAGDAAE